MVPAQAISGPKHSSNTAIVITILHATEIEDRD
jgi:hypothetical protein